MTPRGTPTTSTRSWRCTPRAWCSRTTPRPSVPRARRSALTSRRSSRTGPTSRSAGEGSSCVTTSWSASGRRARPTGRAVAWSGTASTSFPSRAASSPARTSTRPHTAPACWATSVLRVPGFGSASMTGTLARVLVRPPLAEDAARWREYGWRAAPDVAAAAAEHEALCGLLEAAGAEVVVSRHDPGNPDAIYVYDPVLVGSEGAVLLRPGKEVRRTEPAALRAPLEVAGVPVAAAIKDGALVEGGDTVWLDERTLLVGIGYRTNEAAVGALGEAFP